MNDHRQSQGENYSLTASLRTFILKHFHSVEQLEVLLLLRRNFHKKWAAEEVSKVLRTNQDSAANRLKDLHAQKLIAQSLETNQPLYQFAADPEQTASVDELERYYKTHSARVIELIYSRPSDAIQSFSNSFRLWNGKD